MKHITLIILVACVSLSGCTRQQSEEATTSPWPEVRDALIEEYLPAHPVFAVVAGRHEYDGMLPDWSAEGIAAEIRRLQNSRDRAMALPDDALSDAERHERDYVVARLDRDLFWLEVAEAPFQNPAWYLDWMVDNLDPGPYLTRSYAPLDTRMRAYVSYAQAVPRAADQIRATLRTPLSLPLLDRSVSAFRGFAEFYRADVPAIFATVPDAALQAEFAEANAAAAQAMTDLADWLESQRDTATASFALGPESTHGCSK